MLGLGWIYPAGCLQQERWSAAVWLHGVSPRLGVMVMPHLLQESSFQTNIEYAHGFVRTGLWGLSRHPNYGAEQAIWVVYYLFSVAATGEWVNWTAAGMILLFILFKSSSDFSEEISAGKYPEYKDYQQKVPRFIPFLKF